MQISNEERARQIQQRIRQILLRDWDPIGVQDISEAQDEYDSYVGGVYRLLASGATEAQVVDHLWRIENDTIGRPALDRVELVSLARKLRALDVEL